MLPPRLRLTLVALTLVATACGTAAAGSTAPGLDAPDAIGARNDQADDTGSAVDEPASDGAVGGGAADPRPVSDPVVVPLEKNDTTTSVSAMDPPLEPVWSADGPATVRAQERLLELGFWLQETSGQYGVTTTQAVMAFQKYYGLATDGVLGPVTAAALSEVTERPSGRSNTGTLVEIDKTKQLVFIIRDGHTDWVLNASTGSEVPYEEEDQNSPGDVTTGDSVTRTGMFKVTREHDEGWWEGDLGQIYRPKYFDHGIALHGSYHVPAYPASHGCVRVSIPAMDWIWANDIVPKGTAVWVHGEIPSSDAPDA